MRSKSIPNGQTRPSFIEEARRRQIIDSAIEIIATGGLPQASLAEIARRAGCSKGVISYHFEGKEELIDEILSRLIREPGGYVKQHVDSCSGAMDKLRAYVESNFRFMQEHRNHYVALVDLWGSRGWFGGRNRFNAEAYEPSRAYLSRILDAGREQGEFGSFDTQTIASLVQASIDGVMLQWVCDPDAVDLDRCACELLSMIAAHVHGTLNTEASRR